MPSVQQRHLLEPDALHGRGAATGLRCRGDRDCVGEGPPFVIVNGDLEFWVTAPLSWGACGIGEGDPDDLADTGLGSAAAVGAIASALLVAGLGMVGLSRRRRTT